MRKILLVGIGLLGVVGAVTLGLRARLRSARVTSITPGNPPVANVALHYTAGTPPTSVIIDVHGRHSSGSATIAGNQLFVEIPLEGEPDEILHVTATAMYRTLGRTQMAVQEFAVR